MDTRLGREDATLDTESPDSMESGANNVYMGSGFNKPRIRSTFLPKPHGNTLVTAFERFLDFLDLQKLLLDSA